MKYTLIFAKELTPDGTKFDVFNCLNIMQNREFLQELKFGVGDGVLNYYMYNYLMAVEKEKFTVSVLNCYILLILFFLLAKFAWSSTCMNGCTEKVLKIKKKKN